MVYRETPLCAALPHLGLEARVQLYQVRVVAVVGNLEDALLSLDAGSIKDRKSRVLPVKSIANRPQWGPSDRAPAHLSTSSFSMMNSFLSTLMAYILRVWLCSTSMTYGSLMTGRTSSLFSSAAQAHRFGSARPRTPCQSCLGPRRG